MKRRSKQGRYMIAIGMSILLGSTFFRVIPDIDWTLTAVLAVSAFGLIVIGLILTRL
jgi:hypothetical protein